MYDNLIPDEFCNPINFGGPSIFETVQDWILFNPDGDIKQFSEETGVPLERVEKYWKRMVLLSQLPEEERTILGIGKLWVGKYKRGTFDTFCSSLGINYVSAKVYLKKEIDNNHVEAVPFRSTIKDEMDNLNERYPVFDTDKNKILQGIIQEWRCQYPYKTLADFIYETSGSKRNIPIAWKEVSEDPEFQERISKKKEDISKTVTDWCKHNYGNKKDCMNALNLPLDVIKEHWIEEAAPVKNADTSTILINQINDWIADNKDHAGIFACSKELGIPYNKVRLMWPNTIGGDGLKKGSKQTKEIIFHWFQEHPNGTMADCSRDLGKSFSTISFYFHQLVAEGKLTQKQTQFERVSSWIENTDNEVTRSNCKLEFPEISYNYMNQYMKALSIPRDPTPKMLISDWIEHNPQGTIAQCCNDLNLTIREVEKKWKSLGGYLPPKQKTVPNPLADDRCNIIREWLTNNPYGSLNLCKIQTGLPRNFLAKVWQDLGGKTPSEINTSIKQRKVAEITDWIKEHPNGTRSECAIYFGHYNAYAFWEEAGGDPESSKTKKQRQGIKSLIEYVMMNPSSNIMAVSKALGMNYNYVMETISIYKKIKHWKELNPSGTFLEFYSENSGNIKESSAAIIWDLV